jgi:SRSO17 transposase
MALCYNLVTQVIDNANLNCSQMIIPTTDWSLTCILSHLDTARDIGMVHISSDSSLTRQLNLSS